MSNNPGLTSLEAWWKLDEAGGADRISSVPGDGGLLSLTDYNFVGNGVTYNRTPFINAYANFVRSGVDYLRSPDTYDRLSPGFYPTSFSMGFWIRPNSVTLFNQLVGKWSDALNAREYLFQIVSQQARFTVNDGTASYSVTASNFGNLSNSKWYFITGYWDAVNENIRIAVNDVWNGWAGPTTGIPTSIASFTVGTWGDLTNPYGGQMDNLFYYSRVLSDDQWSWLYNWGHGRRYEDVAGGSPLTSYVNTAYTIPGINVYDKEFTKIGIIEDYYSLSWSDRYNEMSDFELELPTSYSGTSLLNFGNFLTINTSDKIMILEERKLERGDTEEKILVNGRSSESMLERRSLLYPLTWHSSAELLIYWLVHNHVRGPGNADRKIIRFDKGLGNLWPPPMAVSEEKIDQQWEVDSNLYLVIEELAKTSNLGFKIVLVEQDNPALAELYFHTYLGTDRSFANPAVNPIVFSDAMGNIVSSSYSLSSNKKVNIVWVKTPGEIAAFKNIFVWKDGNDYSGGPNEPTNIDRFELSIDNNEINRDTDDDTIDDMTDAEALAIIVTRGRAEIDTNSVLGVFEGDFYPRGVWTFGVDYFLGDIVQCIMFEDSVSARIIECIRSYSTEGEKVYLAFDFLQGEDPPPYEY